MGKKIIHFCNYAPNNSGIYLTTRDLVYEELRVGYDAFIVDTTANNELRADPASQDALLKGGRVIGLESYDITQTADLICWHSWIPETYHTETDRPLIMFLHGMPSFIFYNELYGGDAALTFIKSAQHALPHCCYYITMWPSHRPFWEPIIDEKKLVVTRPFISETQIRMKSNAGFDPNHLRLVCMDSWRGGKEPYYIINAVQRLMNDFHLGKTPLKVTLDIYGQGVENVQPVWYTLIRSGLEPYISFKGRDLPQNIFDGHDILLTQIGDESRVIREAMLSGIPIVCGDPCAEWTDYKHSCRDVKGYAAQIMACWQDMQSVDKRASTYRQNRAFACEAFDIRKNSIPIFQCYEDVFDRVRPSSSAQPMAGTSNTASDIDFDDILRRIDVCAETDPLQAVLAGYQTENSYLRKEEALVRFLKDLPDSG